MEHTSVLKTVLEEPRGTVATYANGVVTKADVIAEIEHICNTYDPVDMFGLADFFGSDVSQLSMEEVVEIARLSNSREPSETSRLALVAISTLAFALDRIYVMMGETFTGANRELRIFRNTATAKKWLIEN